MTTLAEGQLNAFRDREGVIRPIGYVFDKKHGYRTGMWYLNEHGKRVNLIEEDLIHIKTFAAKAKSPKQVIWSYKEFSRRFKVTLDIEGSVVDHSFYGETEAAVKRKAIFWASKEFKIEISNLTRHLNRSPEYIQIKEC